MGKNNAVWLNSKALFLGFFFLFFLYPLALVFLKAMQTQNWVQLLFSNAHFFWNSFFQASISTLLSVVLGVLLAFIIARRSFPGKKILKTLSLIPFVFPSILVVVSIVILFGNNGWINNFLQNFLGFEGRIQFLYGFFGIILAHAFYNFPLVARFVSSAWENLDVTMKETARTLGAGKQQVFLHVTLPQLLPPILAAALIVFIYTFMSFAIVLSLGGVSFTTLEIEIYRQVTRNLDFSAGAFLAIAQFFFLLAIAFLHFFFSKKFERGEKLRTEKPEKLSIKSVQGIAETGFLLAAVLFIALPIIALIVFSFFDSSGNFSLSAVEKIFFSQNASLTGTTPVTAIVLSIAFAVTASVTATLAGLIASMNSARHSFLEVFLSASIAVSVITLGFGYLLGFGSGNFWVIAMGHAVLGFPFAFRIIRNALEKIDLESIEAARTLGADRLKTFFWVQLPRVKNALIVALSFCFAISLGELGLVLVLYDGVFATIPVYIYRLLTTFDLHAATAMGLTLVLISFVSFYAIEHFSKDAQVF